MHNERERSKTIDFSFSCMSDTQVSTSDVSSQSQTGAFFCTWDVLAWIDGSQYHFRLYI